ncbi:class I SAM-dependent methyltransferase [bacterium]|nr:class I SAM-dependent methyltransferase [bacterium]MBU1918493.1 class I SAM-dependent methyltransferase [bacterium]
MKLLLPISLSSLPIINRFCSIDSTPSASDRTTTDNQVSSVFHRLLYRSSRLPGISRFASCSLLRNISTTVVSTQTPLTEREASVSCFQSNLGIDRTEIWDDFLEIQSQVTFPQHYGFIERFGLADCHRVYDVGTGNGEFLCATASQHPDISFTAIDLREELIQRAEVRAGDLGIANATFVIGDALDSDTYNDQLYDGVLLRATLMYMSDPLGFLQLIRSRLRKGAHIWMIEPEMDFMHSRPEHEAFKLYKKGILKFYETFGLDPHNGSKIPSLLRDAGFSDVVLVNDPMSNKTIGKENFARFMVANALTFKTLDPTSFTDADMEKIRKFVETVVLHDDSFLGTHGVMMIYART